jgi:hypothetical protein
LKRWCFGLRSSSALRYDGLEGGCASCALGPGVEDGCWDYVVGGVCWIGCGACEILLRACGMGEISVLDLVEGCFPARLVARSYSHDDTIRIRSVGSGINLSPQLTQPWQSLSASIFLALLSDASKSRTNC